MNDLINSALALIYSGSLIFGAGYGLKTFHDSIRKAALTKVTKGLSSSEKLSNLLTGEKSPF